MKALLYDTETTGLTNNRLIPLDDQPEIIEIAMSLVDLKTGRSISTFDSLIQPSKYPMSPQTIKETKTRLSNTLLAKAPLFAKVAPTIRKRIEEAPVVIAHNLSFDKEMIDIEYERLDPRAPIKWPSRCICTVEQSAFMKGHRLNLTALHVELFGKEFDTAHRARPDLDALIRCTVELFKRGFIA